MNAVTAEGFCDEHRYPGDEPARRRCERNAVRASRRHSVGNTESNSAVSTRTGGFARCRFRSDNLSHLRRSTNQPNGKCGYYNYFRNAVLGPTVKYAVILNTLSITRTVTWTTPPGMQPTMNPCEREQVDSLTGVPVTTLIASGRGRSRDVRGTSVRAVLSLRSRARSSMSRPLQVPGGGRVRC